ncbi:heparinase II/III family protein [uncultured Draconibacterium sp.]|uniref:heparinase II/III family protein n=1 Tax=uncultured Draconibacterium sp. TaxID=1573823 RepID=UPI002AA651DD|nr:heparinase II/III family protein [uncultured Draconibacterium sp.]
MIQRFIYSCLLLLPFTVFAQNNGVAYSHVPTNAEIIELLDVDYSSELQAIQNNYKQGNTEQALEELAIYFKERFSERYFFDWKNFENRFSEYNQLYSDREVFHTKDAAKHLELYPASTQWKIGFENLKGETVTSYPYRHLTRQHKAGSIAFLYHYTGNKKYLDYIPEQAASLNAAFNNNQIEIIEDGNGAYECYRAGNRVWNWLLVHQILLASDDYSTTQQLEMIRTFLHTGAKLYHHHPVYTEGNHQTRGMSALAMLAFLFPEIKGADQWKERSLQRLEEHLEREIYPDGFQFERTVHYHVDDIENYFYPYQLAKLNNIELKPIWETRIKGLFDVLLKIAMPNKKAPVLQDDTDSPWAEYNEIDNTMALGAVLFGEPDYVYFASSKVSTEYYWYLKPEQLARLKLVQKNEPQLGSCELPETGYYVMRNGWGEKDVYAIVSAGLTPEKPDHQHADMLGLQVYAFGNVMLPNYQVRYYLHDFPEFKNSWVKSVALLDSIPQGLEWKGNQGGSGFGKFKNLPEPRVLAWEKNKEFDLFVGSHNGYDIEGVKTYRTVIFIKDGFWIVRDQFIANGGQHTTQQVWQGHYDLEKEEKHIRSVFQNGAGLEIIQLADSADQISKASSRGKGRSVFQKSFQNETSWTTLLFPFENFEERLMVDDYNEFKAIEWNIVSGINSPIKTNAKQVIYKKDAFILLETTEFTVDDNVVAVSSKSDLWVTLEEDKLEITNCGIIEVEINNTPVKPGKTVSL